MRLRRSSRSFFVSAFPNFSEKRLGVRERPCLAIEGGLLGAIAPLALKQFFFGLSALHSISRFAQLALDGRRQAGEPLLQQEILGTELHHGHHHIFAGDTGHHDKGNILARFVKDPESRGRIELGQAVIADDHVPGCSRQSGPHVIGVFDAFGVDFVSGILQVMAHECRIAFGIFDLEDPECLAHGVVSGTLPAGPATNRVWEDNLASWDRWKHSEGQ